MADDSESMPEMDQEIDHENDSAMNCENDATEEPNHMNENEAESTEQETAEHESADDVAAADQMEEETGDVEETEQLESEQPDSEQLDTIAGSQQERKGRPFHPTQLEFKYERTREQQERTLILGPATLDDLFQSKIKDYMPHSEQFYIRYLFSEVPKCESSEETSESLSNGEPPKKEHRGLIEVRFSSIEEAQQAVDDLTGLHEGLVVKRITYEFSKTEEFKQLKKVGQSYDGDGLDGFAMKRIIGLVGIDDSVAMDTIKEKIPEVVDVLFPYDYSKNERKGYCYMELKTLEDLKTYVDKSITINDKEYSIISLEEIPPLEVLTKKLDRENIPEYLQFPLDKVKKERIKTLLRQASHHKRLDGISEAKIDMIKKKTYRFETIMKQDFHLRRGRGGRGRGRGDRGGGGRGNMRGFGHPPQYNNYSQGYGRYDNYNDYYPYDGHRRRGGPDRMPRQYGYGGGPPPNKRRMNDNYWY